MTRSCQKLMGIRTEGIDDVADEKQNGPHHDFSFVVLVYLFEELMDVFSAAIGAAIEKSIPIKIIVVLLLSLLMMSLKNVGAKVRKKLKIDDRK